MVQSLSKKFTDAYHFWVLAILTIFFCSLSSATSCSDILKVFPPLERDSELLHAGQFLQPGQAWNQIFSRAGNYPFILFNDGSVIISHRLPEEAIKVDSSRFFATHGSLLRRSQKTIDDIELAGQITVHSPGHAVISDQSGHFHQSFVMFQLKTGTTRVLDWLQHTEQVLQTAATRITTLLSGAPTPKLFNLSRSNYENGVHFTAEHKTDENLARFEKQCLNNPNCKSLLNRMTELHAILFRLGPKLYPTLLNNPKQLEIQFPRLGQSVATILIELNRVGPVELLANESFQRNFQQKVELEFKAIEAYLTAIPAQAL